MPGPLMCVKLFSFHAHMLMFTKRQAVTKLCETHMSASQILHHHWYTQLGMQLAQLGVLYGTKPQVNSVDVAEQGSCKY
jgi:hypothetical protein